MAQEDSSGPGWDSLPPELLRRVVSVLLNDWAYFPPEQASSCLRPVRGVCTAWQGIIDADIKQLALTVPSIRPACLAENFPNATHLDLSRYHHNSQDVLSVVEQMKLRSLTLADPWQPTVSLPTQALQQLTYLSFLAEGLLMTNLASQFCEALVKLKQLEELQLSRLQVSSSAAQMLAHALTELPFLNKLVLTGGAAPMHAPELYVLLNVDMPQLQVLELMRLGVRMLPRTVSRLGSLTRLSFCGEMMRSVQLQDDLLQLTDLKVLDISANLAEQLPGCVLQLTGLKELHAGMNRLGMQAHNFAQMEELETLVLASNKLLALHSSVWALTTLKLLDLGHNNLSDLPAEISSLTGLTYLNVCHNFLTALPAGLAYLTRLVELDISLNTDMRELPTGLGALSMLTRLNASHMRLKQLPNDIGGMVSLEHLDVSHNSLHHLAPQLSSLVHLTHLEATDNKLHQSTAVPEELVALTALKVLRLARNRLQSLPEALGAFSALQVLDCSGNRLTSVPRVVGRCTALQQLLMSSNRLRGLTSGIGNLMRLQLLDLSHNQYRHLPTMTGDLTQLQELLLADNQLEDLPSSCSALLKVTKLTLHSNRLHVLPPAVCRMSGLQSLTLYDNPLLGRDAVVLHLQRQLPGLAIDSHQPLQGAALPARVPEPGVYVLPGPPGPQPAYMTALLSQLSQQGGLGAAAAAAAAAGVAMPGMQQHAAGDASVPYGFPWPVMVEPFHAAGAAAAMQQGQEVSSLQAAFNAQLNLPDRPAVLRLGPALGGARFVRLPGPPGNTYHIPGANARHPTADESVGWPRAGQGVTAWGTLTPGVGLLVPGQPAGMVADGPAAAVGGPQAPHPSPSGAAPADQLAQAAAAGPSAAGAGSSAAAAAAAAGPSSQAGPGAANDNNRTSQAGSTPWASAGSQPSMNLQQLLSDGNATGRHGASPSRMAAWGAAAAAAREESWKPAPHTHPQRTADVLQAEQHYLNAAAAAGYAGDGAAGSSRWQVGEKDGPPGSRVGAPQPAPTGIGRWRHADTPFGPPSSNASPARRRQAGAVLPHAGAGDAAAAAGMPAQAAQAEDAMSTDSLSAAGAAGPAAAAEPPMAGDGQGAAAATAEGEETPSSAHDTECASDTSSEPADGTLTPAMLPDGPGSFVGDFLPAAQPAVRAAGASSSAGGSGGSSAGGASKAGGSSGGGSSWGGSSSDGPGGAATGMGVRPSRFQTVGDAAGVKEFQDGDSMDGGLPQEGQPVEQPPPAAGAPTQEGRSGRYFPFNVLDAAWWGN